MGRPSVLRWMKMGGILCSCASLASASGFTVDPADTVQVTGERLQLSQEAPSAWQKGTKLKQLQPPFPPDGPPVPGSLDPASVTVHFGDIVLRPGEDYLLDPVWGTLGLGPSSKVTSTDWVTVDYRYSLCRLDSVIRLADGRETVRKGEPHLTCPRPPALAAGETLLANVFVDYFQDGKQPDIYPLTGQASEAPTRTTSGRIPKTLAKLNAHEPVKIFCWGDSVTFGGDANPPDRRFVDVFGRRLKAAFPRSPVSVATVAVGGSRSVEWLYPEKYPRKKSAPATTCDWNRVIEEKPDLVIIEFVNDAGLPPDVWPAAYADILARLGEIGSEVIFITPHFTMPSMMKFQNLREPESRPYVKFLQSFAEENHAALADASSRWAHLWKEGIPYVTLLNNRINHPDNRGHAIFADELMACFGSVEAR